VTADTKNACSRAERGRRSSCAARQLASIGAERMEYWAPQGFTALVDKLAVLNGTNRSEIMSQSVRTGTGTGVSVEFEREQGVQYEHCGTHLKELISHSREDCT
jgi:hypothetical protein